VGAPLFKLRLVVAQLRDMLPAEDSSVVAQENNDSRALRPK
jgi:hypothetical protein